MRGCVCIHDQFNLYTICTSVEKDDHLCYHGNRFHVKRGGKDQLLLTADIVVGDLVDFGYGNALPADGVVLEV